MQASRIIQASKNQFKIIYFLLLSSSFFFAIVPQQLADNRGTLRTGDGMVYWYIEH